MLKVLDVEFNPLETPGMASDKATNKRDNMSLLSRKGHETYDYRYHRGARGGGAAPRGRPTECRVLNTAFAMCRYRLRLRRCWIGKYTNIH